MNVIDQLDAEWETLARSPALCSALAGWGREDRALAFADPAALVHEVERRDADPAATDRILAALARRAPHDRWAARVLLQLVLPGCKALLRRYRFGDRHERAALVVAAAWDRIRTYPIERRPAKVAANVLGDVRQHLLRRPPVPPCTSLEGLPERLQPSSPGGAAPAVELADLVTRAVRRGMLDREGARVMLLTRVAGMGVSELSRRDGTSEQTLRRRRLRAEARLRTLVGV